MKASFMTQRSLAWRCGAALAAALAASSAGGTAHAADPSKEVDAHNRPTTLHAIGAFGVVYSDNVLGAPDVPPPNIPSVGPPVTDVALQFAPGAALLHDGPRARWGISYTHPMLLYMRHPLAHSSGDVATFGGMFALSPLDEIDVRLSVSRFTSNVASLNVPAGEAEVGVVRSAATTMVNVGALHAYTRALAERWSLLVAGGGSVAVPLDGGGSMFAGTWSAGPRFALPRHLFGLSANLLYVRPLVGDPLHNGFFSDQSLVVGGEGRWAWDWTERWSSQLTAGAVAPVVGTDRPTPRPIGSAAIRYDDEWGYGASLAWTRGFVPNVVTGQTYYSDTIALRGGLPIYRPVGLIASATAGFAWSRVIDLSRDIDTDVVKTGVANVALGLYPAGLPRLIVAYQYTKQFDAPEGQILLPNFHRNLVSFTLEYMFPPRTLVIARGAGQRADGRDRPKVGE